MLERERLESKKISKTQRRDLDHGPRRCRADDVHIGPSDYVPWLTDRKWAHIRLEGQAFGDVPLTCEMKLEVWDSPNSAGIVIDAVRCCKLALNHGVGGQLDGPSSYLMKSPHNQRPDDEARDGDREVHRRVTPALAGTKPRRRRPASTESCGPDGRCGRARRRSQRARPARRCAEPLEAAARWTTCASPRSAARRRRGCRCRCTTARSRRPARCDAAPREPPRDVRATSGATARRRDRSTRFLGCVERDRSSRSAGRGRRRSVAATGANVEAKLLMLERAFDEPAASASSSRPTRADDAACRAAARRTFEESTSTARRARSARRSPVTSCSRAVATVAPAARRR